MEQEVHVIVPSVAHRQHKMSACSDRDSTYLQGRLHLQTERYPIPVYSDTFSFEAPRAGKQVNQLSPTLRYQVLHYPEPKKICRTAIGNAHASGGPSASQHCMGRTLPISRSGPAHTKRVNRSSKAPLPRSIDSTRCDNDFSASPE